MKKLKFKSIAMRIWITFTAIILIIILVLSLFYVFAYRYIDESDKMQDLLVAHDILLKSNFNEPIRFNELKNLKGSAHFIYSLDKGVFDINKPQKVPHLQSKQDINNFDVPFNMNDVSLKLWLVSFVDDNLYEKGFKKKYEDIDFIFIISATYTDEYLISYMPNLHDNSLMYYILAIGGVFIAIGFVVAKIVANNISKPLSELEKFTVKIAEKNWKEPINLNSDDEIGRLALSMNKMQENLRRADEEEKMFLQSISHDLKTPVMVIMSHADAIIDGVYIETLDKTAQIIKDEAISLNNKIKHLLYLNTLDYVLGNQSEVSEIEFDKLVEHTVDRFKILGCQLKWNLNIDKIKVSGNADKLTVAIENILDNALRYAKSEISISLKSTNNFVHLEIFNDGNLIKPESIGKIFDSLYKDKTGNFGLGLAITKKIITFFGGSISAENRENGVSFVIDYPK